MKDFSTYKKDLENFISYKSVLSTPEHNAPFGTEIRSCLDFFLQRAKDMGLNTINYDGYAGEIFLGAGQEIGIIGHIDVVPIGIGWKTDPFKLTEIDGIYYGRGVSDDKTPLLSCLYALKELKDSNLPLNKKFRLIIGCDEESGWRDLDYLSSKTALPEYGFSPDGNFPLSYAEKGIVEVEFLFPILKNFTDIKGGTVVNAVCDYVTAKPINKNINNEKLEHFGLSINQKGLIESVGKSAHGSTPELGKNAILPLFEYFASLGENVQPILDNFFYDKKGLQHLCSAQGRVTLSPDQIWQDEQFVHINCDLRIPAPFSLEDLLPIFDSFGLSYKTKVRHNPVMVEKEGVFVQTLLNAYNSITNQNCTPISMGGSTFARAFKKGCAFGPKFFGHIDNIHDANENVSKTQILTAYEIYKKAIFDLNKCVDF